MKRYANVWNCPFFGNCAEVYIAYWSVRASGYFEVGPLMDLFYIPLLKPVCPRKRPLQREFFSIKVIWIWKTGGLERKYIILRFIELRNLSTRPER